MGRRSWMYLVVVGVGGECVRRVGRGAGVRYPAVGGNQD